MSGGSGGTGGGATLSVTIAAGEVISTGPTVAERLQEQTEQLLEELVRLSRHISGTTSLRIRIAVTPDEYEVIRNECLRRDGRFCGRFRGHPLMVDEQAGNPPLVMEMW